MDCEEYKLLISKYLDKQLREEEEKKILSHTEKCVDCRRFMEQSKSLGEVIRKNPVPDPGSLYWESFHQKIRARMEDWQSKKTRFVNFPPAVFRTYATIAAVVIIALGAAITFQAFKINSVKDELVSLRRRSEYPAPANVVHLVSLAQKDIELFYKTNESFSQGIKWIAVNGDDINMGLGSSCIIGPVESRTAPKASLINTNLMIMKIDSSGKKEVIASPKIIMKSNTEVHTKFSLGTKDETSVRIWLRPNSLEKEKVSISTQITFYRPRLQFDPQEASIKTNVSLGRNAICLGSLKQGENEYRVYLNSQIVEESDLSRTKYEI